MSSVSVIGSAALQLMRNSAAARIDPPSASTQQVSLLAVANGQSSSDSSIVDPAALSAKSKISGALFSATTPSATQMKLALFEKTGEALGVRQADFTSDDAFRAAVKDAFSQLKLQDGADQTIAAIEQSLGLDKLGVSLETVINAMTEPGGDADKVLDATLAESMQPIDAVRQENANPVVVKRDDIGIYSLAG